MTEDSSKLSRARLRLPALWHFIVQRFKHGERYGLDFTLAFIAIVGAMWVFTEIVDAAVTREGLNQLDGRIQAAMRALLEEDVTRYVVFITNIGGTRGTIIGVLVVGIPLLLLRRWWSLFGLVFSTAAGGLILLGLKEFFARARPEESVIHAGGYAFPSGHAFAAMVFWGYLIYLSWKHIGIKVLDFVVTMVCFLMIFLIGTSRVYLNVHWLTDVLGGFLSGFAWLVISILIVRHVEWPDRSRIRKEHEQRVQAEDSPE